MEAEVPWEEETIRTIRIIEMGTQEATWEAIKILMEEIITEETSAITEMEIATIEMVTTIAVLVEDVMETIVPEWEEGTWVLWGEITNFLMEWTSPTITIMAATTAPEETTAQADMVEVEVVQAGEFRSYL